MKTERRSKLKATGLTLNFGYQRRLYDAIEVRVERSPLDSSGFGRAVGASSAGRGRARRPDVRPQVGHKFDKSGGAHQWRPDYGRRPGRRSEDPGWRQGDRP